MNSRTHFPLVLVAICALLGACGGVSAPEDWSGGVVQMSSGGNAGSQGMPSRFVTVINHLEEPVEVYVNGKLEAVVSAERFASTNVEDIMGDPLQVVVKGASSGTIYSAEMNRANEFRALHIGEPSD